MRNLYATLVKEDRRAIKTMVTVFVILEEFDSGDMVTWIGSFEWGSTANGESAGEQLKHLKVVWNS